MNYFVHIMTQFRELPNDMVTNTLINVPYSTCIWFVQS